MTVTTFLVSAPGKVILSGEHAVVYDKSALAASLGLRTFGVFSFDSNRSDDYHVRVRLPDLDVYEKWNLVQIRSWVATYDSGDRDLTDFDENAIHQMADDSSKMIELKHLEGSGTVENSLVLNTSRSALQAFLVLYKILRVKSPGGGELIGGSLDVCLRSTLPIGAGLGSSAAFSSCIAAGLLLLNGNITSIEGEEAENARSLVNRLAYYSEVVLHGVASGLDNTLSTFGGLQLYSRNAQGSFLPNRRSSMPQILLVDTLLVKNTRNQVRNVAIMNQKYPIVLKSIMEAIHNISIRLSEAWNDDSFDSVAELFTVNHNLLASMGVSHPALDKIVQIATAHGFSGAKLTGAGGGGCAIVYLTIGAASPNTHNSIEQLENALKEQGFECYKTEIGVPGVQAEKVVESSTLATDGLSSDKNGTIISEFYNFTNLPKWNTLSIAEIKGQLTDSSSINSESFTEYYKN